MWHSFISSLPGRSLSCKAILSLELHFHGLCGDLAFAEQDDLGKADEGVFVGSVREGLMYERFVCYRKEYKIHNFVGDYCQISVFFLILPMLIAVGFFFIARGVHEFSWGKATVRVPYCWRRCQILELSSCLQSLVLGKTFLAGLRSRLIQPLRLDLSISALQMTSRCIADSANLLTKQKALWLLP